MEEVERIVNRIAEGINAAWRSVIAVGNQNQSDYTLAADNE